LDHVALTLGLFVAQTKFKMLVSRNILNIYRAYTEWAWHILGFRVFAESIIYSMSYLRSRRWVTEVSDQIFQFISSGISTATGFTVYYQE